MSNEAQMPPDVNAETKAEVNAQTITGTPETPPAAVQMPEPQPVLSINEAGVVNARKRGKAGPSARKGLTAAKRKPEKKAPAARKVAKKAAGTKGRFKPTTAKNRWKAPAKRTAGSKPKAEQKMTPKKKTPARKAAASRRPAAKRATRR
jgi:hypothetical protein